MQEIEVVIKGGSNTGKTTLVYEIKKHLSILGLTVEISEDSQTAKDGGLLYVSLETNPEKINSMIEKGVKIKIKDEQLPRRGVSQ